MKVLAVIQARLGSTRLPEKVLKPLGGKPMLLEVVERVRAAALVEEVVVATTQAPEDDALEALLSREGIKCFRGPEEDVLARYYEAARLYSPQVVVRITADCPLSEPAVIDRVIRERELAGADYASNTLERTYPRGVDVEAFTFRALEEAHREAQRPEEREHVTPYLWSRPGRYRLHNVAAEPELRRPELRLTVDTEEDYMLLFGLFEELGERPGLREVIALLDRKPWLIWINKGVEQKKVFLSGDPRLDAAQEYLEAARLALRQDLLRPALQLAEEAVGLLQGEERGEGPGRSPEEALSRERGAPPTPPKALVEAALREAEGRLKAELERRGWIGREEI